MTFSETGPYTIFVEVPQNGQAPAGIDLTLTAKTTKAVVPLTRPASVALYYWEERIGAASLEFQIETPGPYELAARFLEDRQHAPGTLAIGYRWGERFSRIFVVGGLGLLAWVAVGSAIAALPYLRKQPETIRPETAEARADTEGAPSAPSAAGSIHRLRFHGAGGELFEIFILNVLFTLLTFGIYSFWAKVKTRQYLWGQTEFAGDRFAFHGTGRELLIGWFKAAALFGGLVLLTKTLLPMLWESPLALAAGQLLLVIGIVLLVPLAIIGAMRYRLSRTSWRGIRFSFRGGYRELLGITVRSFVFSGLSLGLYLPIYQTNLRRFLVNYSCFGAVPLKFDGDGSALLGRFVLTLLLTIPTLGLIWIWYFAFQRRYYWDHTSLTDARFHCTVTGGGLLGLYAGNFALVVLSLGLALPWATVRTRRYEMENLVVEGPLDLEHITQQAQTATPTGEELSGFLDVDALPG